MDVITIIVKTLFEVPKVIIQSTCKTAEVVVETSQSAGSVIVGLIFFIVLLILGVRGCVYVFETHVIKSINPDYKTSFEIAEERQKAEKEKIRAEKKAEREIEAKKEAKKPENRMVAAMRQKGYAFQVFDVFTLDDCIWGSGNMTLKDHHYHAVLRSSNNGETYELLSHIDKETSGGYPSKLVFLTKEEGFLMIDHFWADIYKTHDGGKTWEIVLTTNRMTVYPSTKSPREISAKKIQGVNMVTVELLEDGCSVESWGDCKKWIYVKNNMQAAETSNGGRSWKVFSEELLPGCVYKE